MNKHFPPCVFQIIVPFPTRRRGTIVITLGQSGKNTQHSWHITSYQTAFSSLQIQDSLKHCCAPASSGQARVSFFLPPQPSPPKKKKKETKHLRYLRSISPSPSRLPYPLQDTPSIYLLLLQCQETPSSHAWTTLAPNLDQSCHGGECNPTVLP